MKIIYLHQYFNTPAMSGGTRSYEMGSRLVNSGHEVHMITSTRDGRTRGWTTEIVDGMYVHWCNVPYSNSFGYSRRVFAFAKFAIMAARKAVQLGGDLVFATSTPLTIAIPGVWASRRLRAPMVFEVRDLWPEVPIAIGALRSPGLKWLARRLEKFAYRNARQIIALSPGMAEGIVDAGYPREQVTIIPNICNVERFCGTTDVEVGRILDMIPSLKGKKVVLYAGTLGKLNGVEYLVDIASHMRDADRSVAFLVVGDGKERPYIESRARAAGVLGNNFWMLHRVAKGEMPAFFALCSMGCSLFIDLPEMWSNSANKFFDTLAAARPVMVNYSGWQADVLREAGAGIVVPPSQPKLAAELVSNFLGDRSGLLIAGDAAKHLAMSNFDVEELYRDFESVLSRARQLSTSIES